MNRSPGRGAGESYGAAPTFAGGEPGAAGVVGGSQPAAEEPGLPGEMYKERVEDVALKLLHTADWHLGRRFPSFRKDDRDDGVPLTRARFQAVDRILDLAERYRVDAVLCAGDLFDDPAPEREWWEGLAERLVRSGTPGRGTERPVFLLPGNHDPLTTQSVYHPGHPFRRALPEWVHVVDRDDYSHELPAGAMLYAVCCRSRAGQKDPTLDLPQRQPGDERLRVGMVHGQTIDIQGHETNFPIDRHAARRCGLDYLALGDTHGFRDVTPDEPAPTLYPGTPEPTNFGEREAGHVALVHFPRRGRRPVVHKEKVGQWTWRRSTCSEIGALRLLRHDNLRQCVLRLVLEMDVSLQGYAEVEAILTELEGTPASHGRVGILQVDRSQLRITSRGMDEFPADLPPTLRKTVERLQAMEQDATERRDQEVAQRALFHLYRLVRE